MTSFSVLEPLIDALPLPVAIYSADADDLVAMNGPFRVIADESEGGAGDGAQPTGTTDGRPAATNGEGQEQRNRPVLIDLLCEEARRTLTLWRDHAVDPITLDWSDGVSLRPFFRPMFGVRGQRAVLVLLEPSSHPGENDRALKALSSLEGVAITVDDRFGRTLASFGHLTAANDAGGDGQNGEATGEMGEDELPYDALEAAANGLHALRPAGRTTTLLDQIGVNGAKIRIEAEPSRLGEDQARLRAELGQLKALIRRLEAANSALVRRNSELMDQLVESVERR